MAWGELRLAGALWSSCLARTLIHPVSFPPPGVKYVTIRTAEREYLLEESLSHLEQEFAGTFVRIHRNCLAAKLHIRGFEKADVRDGEQGWVVVLDGCKERLAVSRRQWSLVKELAVG